ncbi:hypothetical protein DAPPUDRAFT_256719 [Daphnia pulex]|uniref:Protein kinase domain-containing protein n=1 Tax=Daphnia pulex TaxID=6669 RepID=E9HBY0_DAPPU|nr:hypothetical protein DAPPUDRAFT_256719 [Daphnia pulex]|eukprot:EFX70666.1 hypothetical protein DAPPUDRAFT_256719 [Daphnia pulex]
MGACTKTHVKEEILVIIDFCRFGNLKSYLIKHRNKFINQLNELDNFLPEDETVLHGNLAIRNVLLADHGVVKVADSGMARKMKE